MAYDDFSLAVKKKGDLVPDADPEGHAEVLYVNLMEQVEAADMGLPKKCADDGVTWIGNSCHDDGSFVSLS